jgi:hypothetical protein
MSIFKRIVSTAFLLLDMGNGGPGGCRKVRKQ